MQQKSRVGFQEGDFFRGSGRTIGQKPQGERRSGRRQFRQRNSWYPSEVRKYTIPYADEVELNSPPRIDPEYKGVIQSQSTKSTATTYNPYKYHHEDSGRKEESSSEDEQIPEFNEVLPWDLLVEANGTEYLGHPVPRKSSINLKVNHISGVMEVILYKMNLQVTCSKCRRFVEGDTKFKKNEKVHSLRFNMACECSDSIVEFQQNRIQQIGKRQKGDILLATTNSALSYLITKILCYVICKCSNLYANCLEVVLSAPTPQAQTGTVFYKPSIREGFHYQCQKCYSEAYVNNEGVDVKYY